MVCEPGLVTKATSVGEASGVAGLQTRPKSVMGRQEGVRRGRPGDAMRQTSVVVRPNTLPSGVPSTVWRSTGTMTDGVKNHVHIIRLHSQGVRAARVRCKEIMSSRGVLLAGAVLQVVAVCAGAGIAAAALEVMVASNSSCLAGCSCGILPTPLLQENLTMLDCTQAGLRNFPENLPQGVQALSLSGNSISHVLDAVLAQLIFLRELDLSGNRIKSIGRGGMFHNLTRLEMLDVAKNAISTIFHDNLVGPRALRRLILADNKINYIEDEALADLVSLEELDLQHNYLGSLYQEWFKGLTHLTALNLDHNRIHNIPASVFRPLPTLRHLHLAGNRISSVDPRAFSGLTQLETLTLEDNLLAIVPTAALQSLPALVTLAIDQNPLAKVKPLDFSHLVATTISLSHMPELRILDAKAFYNLPNITSLLLHHNPRLAYVDPLAFMQVDNLHDLQLDHNNLAGLQPDMAHYLSPGVTISLQDNPLLCDCNVRWLRQMADQSNNGSLVVAEPGHLVCAAPPTKAHKLLRDLPLPRLPKTCAPTLINLTQTAVVAGKLGEYKVLECRALGNPRPRLHWVLPDGSKVNSSLNEIRLRFFPPGTLVYYHLVAADQGQYTCVAENSASTTYASLFLNVTGIDIHLFPERMSPTTVTLVWRGTERRAFSSYKIIYNEVCENGTQGEQRETTTSPTRRNYAIARLHPHTTYRFCLGHEDSVGYWLEISCCLATTQPIDYLSQGISSTSNIVAAGVVGMVLVVTMVACLTSVISRRYRHRLYETPDKGNMVGKGLIIPLDNLYRPLLTGS